VDHKYLGAFSERGVRVELVRLQPGAHWSSSDPRARRLLTVRSGDGAADGGQISYLTAIQAEAGEKLELSGGSAPLELFLIGLPPSGGTAAERVGRVRPRGASARPKRRRSSPKRSARCTGPRTR
jgi:hypothetical protein